MVHIILKSEYIFQSIHTHRIYYVLLLIIRVYLPHIRIQIAAQCIYIYIHDAKNCKKGMCTCLPYIEANLFAVHFENVLIPYAQLHPLETTFHRIVFLGGDGDVVQLIHEQRWKTRHSTRHSLYPETNTLAFLLAMFQGVYYAYESKPTFLLHPHDFLPNCTPPSASL